MSAINSQWQTNRANMNAFPTVLCLAMIALAGCNAVSLARHTVNQSLACTELRYRQTLKALAVVAANGDMLPSYGIPTDGIAKVSTGASFDAKTFFDELTKGFKQEAFSLNGSRVIDPSWNIDPVDNPDRLRALHAACCFALYGPPPAGSDYDRVLDLFQIKQDLYRLPPGWLSRGPKHRIPKGAIWFETCGDTAVWVNNANIWALSEFTLVLADIATVYPESLVNNAIVTVTGYTDPVNPQSKPVTSVITPPQARQFIIASDCTVRLNSPPFAYVTPPCLANAQPPKPGTAVFELNGPPSSPNAPAPSRTMRYLQSLPAAPQIIPFTPSPAPEQLP